nr:DUF6119 family protein [uncultured Sediminibacterium sp.]
MSESPTMQAAVYRLDKSHFEEGGFISLVDQVMHKVRGKGFVSEPEELTVDLPDGFEVRLYLNLKPLRPKWMDFFEPLLTYPEKLHQKSNLTHVYLCFVGYGEQVYIITGGQINTLFELYVEQNFGLDIVMRLYKKEEKVVRNTQDRSVTGNILGQTKFFRGDQKFIDDDRFGKIYKQVSADLSKNKLITRLGFADHEIKRKKSGCNAKSSFQLTKALTFEQLLVLIKGLTEVRNEAEEFALNKVHIISRRKSKSMADELDAAFLQIIFDKWSGSEILDVDFCHSNFEDYLKASKYQIKEDSIIKYEDEEMLDLPSLIRYLKNRGGFLDQDIHHFHQSMIRNILVSYDEQNNPLTADSLINHVHGEIEYKNYTYFRIDGEWYRIDPEFISEINKDCEYIIRQCWDEELIRMPFDTRTEGEFNQKFINRGGCLVFDTITPEHIEACDILMYNKKNVFLVCVKQGFDNSIRELTSQISLAAKRIKRDITSDYSFLKKLETKLKSSTAAAGTLSAKLAAQTIPPGGLKEIFSTKQNDNQIVFCFAFVDTAKKRTCTIKDNITEYKSSIAKYSLYELNSQLRALGFGFKIIQLKKS